MKQKRTGYSIDEANELIKKQIQKSAERLKKNSKRHGKITDLVILN
ncbi:MAG TPA: hypothetical protein VI937_00960 [Negativicutes bacterium]|nr:hypothetical protein [Negativicutes bacterium]